LYILFGSRIGTSLAIIAANSIFGFTISLVHIYFDWALILKIAAIGFLKLRSVNIIRRK
jgi:hypothetical protein